MIFGIDKRVFLVGLLLAAVAMNFWTGSRVPALNEKALMGGNIQLTTIGFDTVLPVSEDDPVVKRILYSTVNWLETNRQGMTFGVVVASILMTLLALFRKKSMKSGFSNSVLGMIIGAPLGVCVNCAAPIATGLYTAGARLETTLAAMISSLYWAMAWFREPRKCALFPDNWENFSFICNRRFGERVKISKAERVESIPQVSSVNRTSFTTMRAVSGSSTRRMNMVSALSLRPVLTLTWTWIMMVIWILFLSPQWAR